MKITANGYEYETCKCDEPDTSENACRQIGDVDYQMCDCCHQPIAGTASTHVDSNDE